MTKRHDSTHIAIPIFTASPFHFDGVEGKYSTRNTWKCMEMLIVDSLPENASFSSVELRLGRLTALSSSCRHRTVMPLEHHPKAVDAEAWSSRA